MLFPPPGIMSRQKMEEVINGGGSILFGDTIVVEAKDLPSDVELADLELLRSSWGALYTYWPKLQELGQRIRTQQSRRGWP